LTTTVGWLLDVLQALCVQANSPVGAVQNS
jgi:hypothetical protein